MIIYKSEDKNKIYFQCDQCGKIHNVFKFMAIEDTPEFIRFEGKMVKCKCGNIIYADKNEKIMKNITEIHNTLQMKQCPNCKKIYGDSDYYCLKCNYPLKLINENDVSGDEKQLVNRHEKAIMNPSKPTITSNVDKIQCPNCGSTNIQIVKRGWKITTGFLGSSKNERVCVNCMKKF